MPLQDCLIKAKISQEEINLINDKVKSLGIDEREAAIQVLTGMKADVNAQMGEFLKANNLIEQPIEASKPTVDEGIFSKEVGNVRENAMKAFEDAGFDVVKGSLSETDFGNSAYFYIRRPDGSEQKVRVSDHSVENINRIKDEVHLSKNEDINKAIEEVRQRDKSYYKDKSDKDKMFDSDKQRTESANKKWEIIKPNFEGQEFARNDRTYDDLETFKKKNPDAKNIIQTPLDKGAFSYEYSYDKGKGEKGLEKPSRNYIESTPLISAEQPIEASTVPVSGDVKDFEAIGRPSLEKKINSIGESPNLEHIRNKDTAKQKKEYDDKMRMVDKVKGMSEKEYQQYYNETNPDNLPSHPLGLRGTKQATIAQFEGEFKPTDYEASDAQKKHGEKILDAISSIDNISENLTDKNQLTPEKQTALSNQRKKLEKQLNDLGIELYSPKKNKPLEVGKVKVVESDKSGSDNVVEVVILGLVDKKTGQVIKEAEVITGKEQTTLPVSGNGEVTTKPTVTKVQEETKPTINESAQTITNEDANKGQQAETATVDATTDTEVRKEESGANVRAEFLAKTERDFETFGVVKNKKAKLDGIQKRLDEAKKNGTITESDYEKLSERVEKDYASIGGRDVTVTTNAKAAEAAKEDMTGNKEHILTDAKGKQYVSKESLAYKFPLVANAMKKYSNAAYFVDDVRNLLSVAYSSLFKFKAGALSHLEYIKQLEDVLMSMDDDKVGMSKQEVIGLIDKANYTPAQKKILKDIVNSIKSNKLFSFTEKSKVSENFYSFADNILQSKSPAAFAHEVGHWGFYNVLSADDRVKFYKYAIDIFYSGEHRMGEDLAMGKPLVDTESKTELITNVADNFSEYFAEQFRQYVFDKKTPAEIGSLFEKLAKFFMDILDRFREAGYNKDLVGFFDKIIDRDINSIAEPKAKAEAIKVKARQVKSVGVSDIQKPAVEKLSKNYESAGYKVSTEKDADNNTLLFIEKDGKKTLQNVISANGKPISLSSYGLPRIGTQNNEAIKESPVKKYKDPQVFLSEAREFFGDNPRVQGLIDFISEFVARNPNIKIDTDFKWNKFVYEGQFITPNALGYSFPSGTVILNFNSFYDEQTLFETGVHELVHAITRYELDRNSAFRAEFTKILTELRKKFNLPNDDTELMALARNGGLDMNLYGLVNEKELIAELWGNPAFFDMMAGETLPNSKENIIQYIFRKIMEFFSKDYQNIASLKSGITSGNIAEFLTDLTKGQLQVAKLKEGKGLALPSLRGSGFSLSDQQYIDIADAMADVIGEGGTNEAAIEAGIEAHRAMVGEKFNLNEIRQSVYNIAQDLGIKSEKVGKRKITFAQVLSAKHSGEKNAAKFIRNLQDEIIEYFKENKVDLKAKQVVGLLKTINKLAKLGDADEMIATAIDNVDSIVDKALANEKAKEVKNKLGKVKSLLKSDKIPKAYKAALRNLPSVNDVLKAERFNEGALDKFSELIENILDLGRKVKRTVSMAEMVEIIEDLKRGVADAKSQILQQRVENLITLGKLEEGTTVEEYLELKEKVTEANEDIPKPELEQLTRQLIKDAQEDLVGVDGEFQLTDKQKEVVERLRKLDISGVPASLLGSLLNTINNIIVDGEFNNAGAVLSKVESVGVTNSFVGNVKRLVPKDASKMTFENMVNALFFNDAQRKFFRDKLYTPFSRGASRVKTFMNGTAAKNMKDGFIYKVTSVVDKIKGNNIINDHVLGVYSILNGVEPIDGKTPDEVFNERLDKVIRQTEILSGLPVDDKILQDQDKGKNAERHKQALRDAKALKELGLIDYSVATDGSISISKNERTPSIEDVAKELADEMGITEDEVIDIYNQDKKSGNKTNLVNRVETLMQDHTGLKYSEFKLPEKFQAAYDFAIQSFEQTEADAKHVSETNYGNIWNGVTNYIPLIPIRIMGESQSNVTEIPTSFNSPVTKVAKNPSDRLKQRGQLAGDDIYYETSFTKAVITGMQQVQMDINTSDAVMNIANVMNSKTFRDYINGSTTKDRSGLPAFAQGNDIVFLNKVKEILAEEVKGALLFKNTTDLTDSLIRGAINKVTKAILNSVYQYPKQIIPAMTQLAIEVPPSVLARATGILMNPKKLQRVRELNQEFSGVSRQPQGLDFYDKSFSDTTAFMHKVETYTSMKDIAASNAMQFMKSFNGKLSDLRESVVGRTLMFPITLTTNALSNSDTFVQSVAQLSGYIQGLIKAGVIKNASEFDIEKHGGLDEGFSMGEIVAARVNSVSSSANKASVTKPSAEGIARYLWYLQGFSLNAYMEAKNSVQVMFSDVASGADKSEAARHLSGYVTQLAVFQGLRLGLASVTAYSGAVLAESIVGALSEPPETEEEKQRKGKQKVVKFVSDLAAEGLMGGTPAPAQSVVKEGVNTIYKSYMSKLAKNYKEETGKNPEDYELKSDPKWDIFYNSGEQGAMGPVISASKGMLKATEEEQSKKLSEENRKAVDDLQKIWALGIILGNGDLMRIAGSAERQIKSQK